MRSRSASATAAKDGQKRTASWALRLVMREIDMAGAKRRPHVRQPRRYLAAASAPSRPTPSSAPDIGSGTEVQSVVHCWCTSVSSLPAIIMCDSPGTCPPLLRNVIWKLPVPVSGVTGSNRLSSSTRAASPDPCGSSADAAKSGHQSPRVAREQGIRGLAPGLCLQVTRLPSGDTLQGNDGWRPPMLVPEPWLVSAELKGA